MANGVLRVTGRSEGFVETAQHLDIAGDEPDALTVEWTTRSHDFPSDIPNRLPTTSAGWSQNTKRNWIQPLTSPSCSLPKPRAESFRVRVIEFTQGGDFAGLWGGSTALEWRRRGIYGAICAAHAERAQARRVSYLQVDASAESAAILKRRGFIGLTTTTPYLWPRRELGDTARTSPEPAGMQMLAFSARSRGSGRGQRSRL